MQRLFSATTARLLFALLVPVGWLAPHAGWCQTLPVTSITGDTRLQERLRVVVPGRPLDVTLAELAKHSSAALEVEPALRDQKLILVTHRSALGPTLKQVADHFDYQWKPLPSENGPTSQSRGFRLTQTRARAQLAARSREEAVKARERTMRDRLSLYIRALNAPPEQFEALAAQDPTGHLRLYPLNPFIADRVRLGGALSAPTWDLIFAGKPYQSPPYAELPPQLQKLMDGALGLARLPADERDAMRFQIRYAESDGNLQLMISRLLPNGRPTSGGSLTPGVVIPGRNRGVPLPPSVTDPARQPKDPSLHGDVELLDEKGKPLPITAGLPILLPAVARASGLNVLSDLYSDPRIQCDPSVLGKRPLWQILNIVAEQYELEWKKSGDFLLFRHRNWYEEEIKDVPERALAPWRSEVESAPGVNLPEFLAVTTALSEPQLDSLPLFMPQHLGVDRPRAWVAALGSLDAAQRESLLDGQPLPLRSLKPTQQRPFVLLLQQLVRAPVSAMVLARTELRLTVVKHPNGRSGLKGSLTSGDRVLPYAQSLPAKLPPPPPINVEPVAL